MNPGTPESMHGAWSAARCAFVRPTGLRCGSPARRGKDFCHFHYLMLTGHPTFPIPPLEDANSIQVGIMAVLRALALRTIDHKTGSLMLYGLQIASANLRGVRLCPDSYDLHRDYADARKFDEDAKPPKESTSILAGTPLELTEN